MFCISGFAMERRPKRVHLQEMTFLFFANCALGTIQIVVSVLIILILHTLMSFTGFYSFQNVGSVKGGQQVNIMQIDPIVIEYEQKDIYDAPQRTLLGFSRARTETAGGAAFNS